MSKSQTWINDAGTAVVLDENAAVARYEAAGYRPMGTKEIIPIQQHEYDALPDDHPLKQGGGSTTTAIDPGGKPIEPRSPEELRKLGAI